ncbi:MAG: TlpA disulfide reductase family protein [Ignavibacteriales bacterium]|nr:TlpA disulfide reductase family protein [Ignavibacteriales bacterium]
MMLRKIFMVLILLFIASQFEIYRAQEIKVEPIDKTKLTKLIKDRNGKVLFLNLWATWCIPCREEFPSIVKLAGEMQNVEFVGISADYPDEVKTKIIPFLKSNKANFTNYVSGFSGDEDLINALDKKWNGALPATLIYDKNGKKISFLKGKQSYEKFKADIKKADEQN